MKKIFPICHDCESDADNYMVKDLVWRRAFPDYKKVRFQLKVEGKDPRILLCFDCLEKRLGRLLTAEDFDLSVPVNAGIALGIRIGRND